MADPELWRDRNIGCGVLRSVGVKATAPAVRHNRAMATERFNLHVGFGSANIDNSLVPSNYTPFALSIVVLQERGIPLMSELLVQCEFRV